jgi:hypothetical protein
MEKDVVVTQLDSSEKEFVEEVVDDEEEVEEEVEDKPTEDTESKETESTEEKPKKQSSSERKRYAEMRRAREAKEREQAIKKAKQEGVIEGLGGTNPYTGEKIEDDIDYELYQEMKDAESKGFNPNNTNDMLKYRKQVKLEAKKQEEELTQANLKTQNDISEFKKSNPNVDVKELLENEEFQEFSDGMLGVIPLATIYDKFTRSNSVAKKQAEEIAINEKARRASSAGSLTNGDNVEGDFTMEQISKMSREEIEKNYDKVMKAYFNK